MFNWVENVKKVASHVSDLATTALNELDEGHHDGEAASTATAPTEGPLQRLKHDVNAASEHLHHAATLHDKAVQEELQQKDEIIQILEEKFKAEAEKVKKLSKQLAEQTDKAWQFDDNDEQNQVLQEELLQKDEIIRKLEERLKNSELKIRDLTKNAETSAEKIQQLLSQLEHTNGPNEDSTLKQRIQALEEALQEKEEAVWNLEEKLESESQKLKAAINEAANHFEKNQKLMSQINNAVEADQKRDMDLQMLQEMLRQKEDIINELNDKFNQEADRVKVLTKQLVEKEESLQSLSHQLENSSPESENEELTLRIQVLEETLKKKDSFILTLEDNIENDAQKAHEMSRKLSEDATKIQEYLSKLDGNNDRDKSYDLDTLLNLLEQQENKLRSMTEELNQVSSASTNLLPEYHAKIAAYEEAQSRIANLEADLQQAIEEADHKETVIKKLFDKLKVEKSKNTTALNQSVENHLKSDGGHLEADPHNSVGFSHEDKSELEKELEDAKQKIDSLQNEVLQVQSIFKTQLKEAASQANENLLMIESRDQEIASLHSEIESLLKIIAKLEKEIDASKNNTEASDAEANFRINQLMETVREITTKFEAAEKQNIGLNTSCQAAVAKVEALQRELFESSDKQQQLSTQLDKLQKDQAEIQALSSKIYELETEIDFSQAQRMELESSAIDGVTRIEKFMEAVREIFSQLEMTKKQNETLASNYQAAVDKIASLEQELKKSIEQQDQLNDDLNKLDQDHIETYGLLQKELKDAASKIKDLEAEHEEDETLKKALTEKLDLTEKKLIAVETQLTEASSGNEQRENLSLDYQNALATIKTLENELNGSEEKLQELNAHLNKLEEEHSKTQKLLQQELEEAATKTNNLEHELQENEAEKKVLTEKQDQLQQELEETNIYYQQALEKIKTLENNLEHKQNIENAQQKIEELESQREQLMDKVRSLEDELSSSLKKQEELTTYLKQIQENDVEQQSMREQSYTESLEAVTLKIKELEIEQQENEASRNELKDKLVKAEEQIVILQSQVEKGNEEQSNDYQQAIEKIKSLEAALEEARDAETAKQNALKQVDELEGNCKRILEKVQHLEEELSSSLKEQERLTSDLRSIQANRGGTETMLEKELKESLVAATSKIKELKFERDENETAKKALTEKLLETERKLMETQQIELARQSELQHSEDRNADYHQALEKIAILESELSASLEKQQKLTVHMHKLQEDLASKDMEIAEIAQELEKKMTAPPKVVTDTGSVNNLKEMLRNTNVELSKVAKKNEHLKSEILQYTQQLLTKDTTINELKTHRDELMAKYVKIEENRRQLLAMLEQVKAPTSQDHPGSVKVLQSELNSLSDQLVVIKQAFFKLVLDEAHKYDHYHLLINFLGYDDKSKAVLREYVEAKFNNKLDNFWSKFDSASLVQEFLKYVEKDIAKAEISLAPVPQSSQSYNLAIDGELPTTSEGNDILKLI